MTAADSSEERRFEALERIEFEIASTLDLERILTRLTEGLVEGFDAALARVWLTGPGDLCDGCRMAESCPERERCLHLRASAGVHRGLRGHYRRVPIGAFKIGRIAGSHERVRIRDVTRDDRVPNKLCVREHDLRSFAGFPLHSRDEPPGVLGIFARRELSDTEFDRLSSFADRASVAIRNAGDFQEVERSRRRLEDDNRYLRDEIARERDFRKIVGRSSALKQLLDQVERVGRTGGSALIVGGPGTGKTLIAHALHEAGPRRGRPLIKLGLRGRAASSAERALFGHASETASKPAERVSGLLDLADSGTIYLDEVAELTHEIQARLLRVLQTGEFEPVGCEDTRHVDVRVIAGTRRSLAAEVDSGRFRSDLFYRLSVFSIELPSLRRRKSDIPILVDHFVRLYSARAGRRFDAVPKDTLSRLEAYPWPGNVRELQIAVERAVMLSRGPRLDFEHAGPTSFAEGATDDRVTLREAERAHILATLARTGGIVEGRHGAARVLDLPPSTLRSRMARLGIKTFRGVEHSPKTDWD